MHIYVYQTETRTIKLALDLERVEALGAVGVTKHDDHHVVAQMPLPFNLSKAKHERGKCQRPSMRGKCDSKKQRAQECKCARVRVADSG